MGLRRDMKRFLVFAYEVSTALAAHGSATEYMGAVERGDLMFQQP